MFVICGQVDALLIYQLEIQIENYRIKRYKTKSWIRARLQMGIGDATRPELMDGPFDNFWFERELLNYYKFLKLLEKP